ncbi:MAG: hypothetical protein FWG48_06795 [Oscillospiraceae bacterium]|nr:hypothetical protein [Oscillospiraceae bacterium]
MGNDIKDDLKKLQEITFEAYKASGALMATLSSGSADLNGAAASLERVSEQYEAGAVALRNICDKRLPRPRHENTKPAAPRIDLAGKVDVNEYGWLHIELNALLPNCRYKTPDYLADTVTRLLDDFERRGRRLPRYDRAMLIIDEHCDIDSRQVFDQDNKGWKAIPNALKNRVIKDDDQFSLSVALISTRSKTIACHIYLIPQGEAGDFFCLKADNCPVFP